MSSPSPSSSASRRVWFVTGAGRGLGRAFVGAALRAGDRVVATVRRPGALDELACDVGMALEGRRDDYARDPRFTWPAP